MATAAIWASGVDGAATMAEPKLERQGKAWKVEHHENRQDLVVTDTNPKQSVHIYKCRSCTIRVEGKVNEILLDNCERVGLIFDDVIGSVDIINSKNCEAEVKGVTPSFVVDKSTGITLYLLTPEAESAAVFTSCSMEVNVMTAPKKPNGPPVGHPVPQQYVSNLVNGQLVTKPVPHGRG